jgi:hypothetical protein
MGQARRGDVDRRGKPTQETRARNKQACAENYEASCFRRLSERGVAPNPSVIVQSFTLFRTFYFFPQPNQPDDLIRNRLVKTGG